MKTVFQIPKLVASVGNHTDWIEGSDGLGLGGFRVSTLRGADIPKYICHWRHVTQEKLTVYVIYRAVGQTRVKPRFDIFAARSTQMIVCNSVKARVCQR